ncbi:MAG: hypothetical protein ACJAXS_000258 [Colwellia sp.]|jgi:hypothetical protein
MKSERIYKFYGYRDFDLDAFAGSYLWFSKVKDFNDPFEGLYREQVKFRKPEEISNGEIILFYKASALFKGATEEQANDKAISYFSEIQKDLDFHRVSIANALEESILKTLDEMENNRHCCCFIRDYKDKKALTNKLMWSHYANGLRGFALEFENNTLCDSFDGNHDFKTQGGIVNYRRMEAIDNFESMMDWLKGDTTKGISQIFLTKSPEWMYEQELRILSNANKFYYDYSVIKSIVLGQKMPKEKLNTLMAVIHSLGLTDKVKVATIDKQTFNLSIVDFDKDLFE